MSTDLNTNQPVQLHNLADFLEANRSKLDPLLEKILPNTEPAKKE